MIDRYKILEQLGEGGAGSVFKAWDQKLQRHVALKLLLAPDQREPGAPASDLAMEAAAISSLQHPNIVAVYDLDTDGPEPFVVMEFINGETLEQTVRRGALMTDDFLRLADEALVGLSAAHRQGVMHRDVKPSNLMAHWLPDGVWQVKLLDFGLAKFSKRPVQQDAAGGRVAGSIHFMAPEQFLHRPLDARTDLYAMGCVFYYALTAGYPCQGSTVEEVTNAHLAHQVAPLRSLRADVAPLLTDWVMWLMSRQPEERPESADEALRVLRGIRSGELTALPVRRGLKTQSLPRPVTGTAAVVEAPLSRDAAQRRAAAAMPTAPQDAPRQIAQTSPRPPTPVPKKRPAPPAPPPRRKSMAPLVAILILAVAGAGAAAFFFTKKKPDPVGTGGNATHGGKAPAPVLPEAALFIWYDGEKGGRNDDGARVAVDGDFIDHWEDSALPGGKNPAQYHAGGTDAADRLKRRPQWTTVRDKAGLKGTHRIMAFRGDQCLIFARDRNKIGDPVANRFQGSGVTWIGVFSASDKGTQALLCAHAGSEWRAWSTFVRDGKVFSGVCRPGGAENLVFAPFDTRAGYHIVCVVWDITNQKLRQWVTGPDGRTTASSDLRNAVNHGPVSEIRLGAMHRSNTGSSMAHYLDGGIASLLMWERALPDSEREAAVAVLARKDLLESERVSARRTFSSRAPGSS